ncbi:MAG: oligosaccharide flippase family protein [Deltaproteobacteria bacterium]|nr:oligosaccharide flippase family protein [Deltaproteobacteria bacterium]
MGVEQTYDRLEGADGRGLRPDEGRFDETKRAVSNAGILAAAMAVTWLLAFAVRVAIPRALGPTVFGQLYFAESCAIAFLALSGFGVDTYIRKEVATRAAHASEFLGTVIIIRLVTSLVLVAALVSFLHFSGHPQEVQTLGLLFGMTQILVVANASLGALLHAVGEVRELALLHVSVKVVWALGIGLVIAFSLPILVVPAVWMATEISKLILGWPLARKYLGLELGMNFRATGPVLRSCIPYLVATLSSVALEKICGALVGVLASPEEAGFYGIAWTLAAVALFAMPLLASVLVPMASRAAAHSAQALSGVMEDSLRLSFAIMSPVCVTLVLGARPIVTALFGEGYRDAAPAVRVIAVCLPLTYIATHYGIYVLARGRSWVLAYAALLTLVASPLLTALLIPAASRLLGPGGAAAGAGCAAIGTEIASLLVFHRVIDDRPFTRTSISLVARLALLVVLMAGLTRGTDSRGPFELAIGLVLLLPCMVVVGLVRARDLEQLRKWMIERVGGRSWRT